MEIYRQIGEILVRVDNLEPVDRVRVEDTVRLIKDINGRADLHAIIGMLAAIATVIMIVMLGAITNAWQYPHIFVPSMIGAGGAVSIMTWRMVGRRLDARTAYDFVTLNCYCTLSTECRRFIAAYCRAHPDFEKIMRRHQSVQLSADANI